MCIIKYISDLHIERRFSSIKFKKNQLGGNLFIAGDIGSPLEKSYWDFLKYTSNNFDKVYFTTGNHEYWNNKKYTIDNINNLIKDKVNNLSNTHFLNNEINTENENYNIIGSTLWSYPKYEFYNSMDYSMIYYNDDEKLNYKTMRKLHIESICNINNLLKIDDKPIILLSHYLPSYDFTIKKKHFVPFYSLFASELDYMITEPIKVWIFGHTHDKFVRDKNGVKCCVNAVGYKNEISINEIKI